MAIPVISSGPTGSYPNAKPRSRSGTKNAETSDVYAEAEAGATMSKVALNKAPEIRFAQWIDDSCRPCLPSLRINWVPALKSFTAFSIGARVVTAPASRHYSDCCLSLLRSILDWPSFKRSLKDSKRTPLIDFDKRSNVTSSHCLSVTTPFLDAIKYPSPAGRGDVDWPSACRSRTNASGEQRARLYRTWVGR